MKLARVIVLLFVSTTPLRSQMPPLDVVTSKEFLEQLQRDHIYNFISSKVAKSLIAHRVDPVLPHKEMMARISGTVIVAFEITKEGKVRHATAVSGNRMVQPAVLSAVRQWRFKPYELNGEPIVVATSIPIRFSNF